MSVLEPSKRRTEEWGLDRGHKFSVLALISDAFSVLAGVGCVGPAGPNLQVHAAEYLTTNVAWQNLAEPGRIRQNLAAFGRIRQSSAEFGRTRQNSAATGRAARRGRIAYGRIPGPVVGDKEWAVLDLNQ